MLQGFLPEAADQFAQDVVYPSFSPTVGFFLLLSSLYGIWKVCSSHSVSVSAINRSGWALDICSDEQA